MREFLVNYALRVFVVMLVSFGVEMVVNGYYFMGVFIAVLNVLTLVDSYQKK